MIVSYALITIYRHLIIYNILSLMCNVNIPLITPPLAIPSEKKLLLKQNLSTGVLWNYVGKHKTAIF